MTTNTNNLTRDEVLSLMIKNDLLSQQGYRELLNGDSIEVNLSFLTQTVNGICRSTPSDSARSGEGADTPESMAASNARHAIDGAIQYGRENRNPPPDTEHWLYEYWSIGRQLATLGATGWDNVTPLATAPAPQAAAAGIKTWQERANLPAAAMPCTSAEQMMCWEIADLRAVLAAAQN